MERLKVAGSVPVEDAKSLSYDVFRRRYLLQNAPVVVTGLMDHWKACRDWICEDGSPDLSFLGHNFGGSVVQVADCGHREFTDQKRLEMTLADFINYWLSSRLDGEKKRLLYLKDWHFVKEYPEYEAYTTPVYFSDDWLNDHLDRSPLHVGDTAQETSCSDYRFVYMGPKGTWTPLHADVLRSYSWSANVCGRKQWHLLPPEQTPLLYDRHKRHTVYDIYGTVSQVEYPRFEQTAWLECVQNAGEVIFVPSGWYHQVTNLEDSISINHNWFNACNLHWVWRLLEDDYKETVLSIEDIRSISDNFEMLCQRNLAANSGMNYNDFLAFLSGVLEKILDQSCALPPEVVSSENAALLAQSTFDLACIRSVLKRVCHQLDGGLLHERATKLLKYTEELVFADVAEAIKPSPSEDCHV